jgi:hypothetical protein
MSQTPTTPSLPMLIAAFWTAEHEATIAARHTDAQEKGTPEYEAFATLQKETGVRLGDATIAICAFVPTRRFDAKRKTQFLMDRASENYGRLEEDETAALLESLSDLVKWECGRVS